MKEQQYPELSSYQFASNSPIQFIDLDGLEGKKPKTYEQQMEEFYRQEKKAIKSLNKLFKIEEKYLNNEYKSYKHFDPDQE
ncbi:MAG: hypothetical protein KKA07_18750 [Bacteroidetes bacterium]|nr:hypothetical protein [Bacteroidota bacterium]MBU1721112.1 hypothetical protein [Bacteroidota bacterium]